MAEKKYPYLQLLFFISFCAAFVIQGVAGSRRTTVALSYHWKANHIPSSEQGLELKNRDGQELINKNSKRLMIGSVAPTCTYNECRGCKYKCRAEQVPVEGNDPINSAYHYKCVCHSLVSIF